MTQPATPPSPTPPSPSPGAPPAGDPSMEDILASIRRILSEDEPAAGAAPAAPVPAAVAAPAPMPAPTPAPTPASASEVLALDESMIVQEPTAHTPAPPQAPAAHAAEPMPTEPMPVASPAEPAPPLIRPRLVAAEAEAAASASVGTLLRTLIAGREQVPVHRGGPTIEDLVREEIRPLLKDWLDTNLPPLVERLVRAELERVVGRAIS